MSSLTTDGIGSDNVARSSRPVLGFRWPPLSSKSTETCPACRSVGCALPVGSWPARWRGAGRPVPFGEGMIAGGAEAGTNRARPQRAARKRVTARWWWVGDDRQVTSATRASQKHRHRHDPERLANHEPPGTTKRKPQSEHGSALPLPLPVAMHGGLVDPHTGPCLVLKIFAK